jgi:hypothetical protein
MISSARSATIGLSGLSNGLDTPGSYASIALMARIAPAWSLGDPRGCGGAYRLGLGDDAPAYRRARYFVSPPPTIVSEPGPSAA